MKPKRIQRKRTKGWRMPENTIYVGRGSKWGNPFKIGTPVRECCGFNFIVLAGGVTKEQWLNNAPLTREQSITFFRYLIRRHKSRWPIHELRGKNLACWCNESVTCHADILLEVAND